MARPRIFISSTYYDLKHIRASLDIFIQSLGYESVLSEKGDIAYAHDRPLDQSCYREAENSDIFLLIVGGRYGSEASENKKDSQKKGFFERYESITKKEYESANKRDIPAYILVENGVHSEYLTYQRNKENETIEYAHVDSVNIFKLLDEIFALPRNNPTKTFERFSDIETWLRDQWAGLFRDLLNRETEQKQLSALTVQIGQLAEVNETLKKYLEAVVKKTVDNSADLISFEKKRLDEAKKIETIRANRFFNYANERFGVELDFFVELMKASRTHKEFAKKIADYKDDEEVSEQIEGLLSRIPAAGADFDAVRSVLGLSPIGTDVADNVERARKAIKAAKKTRKEAVTRKSSSS